MLASQKQPFFSIIIPVYNTEKYISDTLNSLIKQSFTDFEVILINDGSKDSSFDICHEYAKNDSRFKLFENDSNLGISSSRNNGISNANGLYCLFLDSDDQLANNTLISLYNILNNKNIDICFFGFKSIKNKNIKDFIFSSDYVSVLNKRHFVNCMHNGFDSDLISCVGSKAYRTRFLKDNNLLFSDRFKYHEDLGFILSALFKSQNVYILNEPFYEYHIRENGSTMTTYSLNRIDSIILARYLYKELFIANDLWNDNAQRFFYLNILSCILQNVDNCYKYNKNNFKKLILKISDSYYFGEMYFAVIKNIKISFAKLVFIKCIKTRKIFLLKIMLKVASR